MRPPPARHRAARAPARRPTAPLRAAPRERRPVTLADVRAATNPALVLWRFSRPHTIIGTALSVVGLYLIAAAESEAGPAYDLLATLVAGLTVNIAIVGVNQITDVEIDRINKPWLPIAAGDLSLGAARSDRARLHRRSRWRSR